MRMEKWIRITGPLVARVCVVRRETQLSLAATLVLFSAVSIRKILATPRSRCGVLVAVYSLPSLESVL